MGETRDSVTDRARRTSSGFLASLVPRFDAEVSLEFYRLSGKLRAITNLLFLITNLALGPQVEALGFDLFGNELLNVDSNDDYMILKGLEEFREHLGGQLTITLLKGIGIGFEVHEVDLPVMIQSIHEASRRFGQKNLAQNTASA